MSFIPVFVYIVGIAVFGVTYYIIDGMLDAILSTNVGESGIVMDLFIYLWAGILIIYLIFGGWWMIRKYNETEYRSEY